MPWSAPEVLVGTAESGVVATTATDMYQLGGTLHEILSCGDAPVWWLLRNTMLLAERRCSSEPVEIPGSDVMLPGLLGKSTLEAAALDRKPITWRVKVDGSEGSGHRLGELVAIMEGWLPGGGPDQAVEGQCAVRI
jgi:hypothetical protein